MHAWVPLSAKPCLVRNLNSKEYLPVFCLLIRVFLAQQFTYITHLFGKQIDSLICYGIGWLRASLVLESGGRFLPEGKSFGKEGWVFLSTYLHMLLSYKGDRRPSWYRRRSGAMDNDRPYTPTPFRSK